MNFSDRSLLILLSSAFRKLLKLGGLLRRQPIRPISSTDGVDTRNTPGWRAFSGTRKPAFILRLSIITGMFLVSGTGWAQTATDVVSLEEYVRSALELNPALQAQSENINISRERVKRAKSYVYPRVKFQDTFTRLRQPFAFSIPGKAESSTLSIGDDKLQIKTFSLSQPLYTGGRAETAYKLANVDISFQRELVRKEREDLARSVAEAYFGLHSAVMFREVASQALTDVLSHEKQVRNLIEAGVALKNDGLKVGVSVLERRESLVKAENAVALASQNLENLTSLPVSPESKFAPYRFKSGPIVDGDLALGIAVKKHPLIQALFLRLDMQKKAVKIARGEAKPTVGFQWNYNSGTQFQEDQSNWDATVAVGYNLFDAGEVKSKVSEEKRNLKKQLNELEDLKRKIKLAIQSAILKLKEADSRLALSTKAEEQARESMRLTEVNNKEGAATSQDLLDAESALVSARNRLVTASLDKSLAEVSLWHTLGCCEPAVLNDLDLPAVPVPQTASSSQYLGGGL